MTHESTKSKDEHHLHDDLTVDEVLKKDEQTDLKDLPIVVSLHGTLDEEKSEEILADLYSAAELLKNEKEKQGEDYTPGNVHFLISTPGGDLHEMFAIYDAVQNLKKYATVTTCGMGKVMSAGALLLASGTKNHRKVSKNCRIMLHSISVHLGGDMSNFKIEHKEIKSLQDMYIDSLEESTNLSKKQIQTILKKSSNTYYSADQAIKYGLVDQIY